jgi:hypothetical protein
MNVHLKRAKPTNAQKINVVHKFKQKNAYTLILSIPNPLESL